MALSSRCEAPVTPTADVSGKGAPRERQTARPEMRQSPSECTRNPPAQGASVGVAQGCKGDGRTETPRPRGVTAACRAPRVPPRWRQGLRGATRVQSPRKGDKTREQRKTRNASGPHAERGRTELGTGPPGACHTGVGPTRSRSGYLSSLVGAPPEGTAPSVQGVQATAHRQGCGRRPGPSVTEPRRPLPPAALTLAEPRGGGQSGEDSCLSGAVQALDNHLKCPGRPNRVSSVASYFAISF